MEISFIKNNQVFAPGDFANVLTEENLANTVLCPAANDETGNEISIYADFYVINRKRYDIKGYSIKAILTEDKRLIPCLRPSRGLEQGATQTVIPGTQHTMAQRLGSKTSFWPVIEGGATVQETTEVVSYAFNYALTLSKKKAEPEEEEDVNV
jgi:hypothetical protein